jgi:hypothetical protein
MLSVPRVKNGLQPCRTTNLQSGIPMIKLLVVFQCGCQPRSSGHFVSYHRARPGSVPRYCGVCIAVYSGALRQALSALYCSLQ